MHEGVNNRWFIETFTPYEAHMHGVKKFISQKRTKYQQMDFVETYRYGKTLFLDGKIQSSFGDEAIYHEALVHPALLLHPEPERILIIGGGEGATLREALKHKCVKEVVMVDIDRELVEECKKILPEWSCGAFDDRRTKLVFADAREWLEKSKEKFDCIIIDLPEPLKGGPAYLLYTREFYNIVSEHLSPLGAIALQAGTTRRGDTLLLCSIAKTLATSFKIVRAFQAIIPSFDLPWGFLLASKKVDPLILSPDEINRKIRMRKLGNLKYYDGITHIGIFSLPKYLREDLKKIGRCILDKKPLFLDV